MKIHKDIEQGTPEWYEIRKGKMTASNAQAIGNNGKGLETYITSLMAEFYATDCEEKFTNGDMERGTELEQYARNVYELETGQDVEQVGFIEIDEFTGCSPDGLVGEEGGIEIKCLNNINHFKLILNEEIDSKYLWQIQMCLLLTGRKWWDFVGYNENYSKALVIKRIYPDEKKQEKIKEGLEKGKKLIQEIKEKI